MEKILIADDNLQITKILSEFAKKEGYEPMAAYDGESGSGAVPERAVCDDSAGCDDAQAGRF